VTDDDILDELRKLEAENGGKQITNSDAVMRLTLGYVASMKKQQDKLMSMFEMHIETDRKNMKELEKNIEKLVNDGNKRKETLDQLSLDVERLKGLPDKVDNMTITIEKLVKNPAVILGEHLTRHPWMYVAIMISLVILVAALSNENFALFLLSRLGFDISSIITPTPIAP